MSKHVGKSAENRQTESRTDAVTTRKLDLKHIKTKSYSKF